MGRVWGYLCPLGGSLINGEPWCLPRFMSPSSFSLLGLAPIVQRWKNLILVAVALAAAVSIVVALLLPNVYKSTAIFIPTNPQTADPDRLVEGTKLELSGRSEDLDRVITIGESQPVALYVIRKFNLYKHYKVGDPGTDASDDAVLREFTGNLDITHNERDAIELTFRDEDKLLAARIANDLVNAIDSVNQQLTLENRRKVLGLYSSRYEYLKDVFEQSRVQLVAARNRYGIYGLEQQGRYMAKQLIETEGALRVAEGGGPGSVPGLRRALYALTHTDGGNRVNIESYVRGADSLSMFTSRVTDLQTRLVAARAAFETAEITLKSKVSSLYMVQKAYPATKKSAPVRWLIVVSSVLVTFGLSVLLVALLEIYRYNRTQFGGPAAA